MADLELNNPEVVLQLIGGSAGKTAAKLRNTIERILHLNDCKDPATKAEGLMDLIAGMASGILDNQIVIQAALAHLMHDLVERRKVRIHAPGVVAPFRNGRPS